MSESLSTNQFIDRAKLVHGDRYDYSEAKYTRSRSKVRIICKLHGFFDMVAQKHVHNKNGCPKCRRFGTGTKDALVKRAENEKIKSASVYIAKLDSDGEIFYKIGLTLGDPKISMKYTTDYDYNIFFEIKASPANAWDFKEHLLGIIEVDRYYPIKKFYGHTQCFHGKSSAMSIAEKMRGFEDGQQNIKSA